MVVSFVAFLILFAALLGILLTMVEGETESGRAFRLLCKMITHDARETERIDQRRGLAMVRELRSRLPWLNERVLRPLLQTAGYYIEQQADVTMLLWIAMLAVALLLAALLPGPTVLWTFLLFTLAGLGPYVFLRLRAHTRRKTIARSLPDVIDLLVICVEAGLGLDQAILRVSEELADTHPQIHLEFGRLMQHQRAGVPRLEAWQRMAERLSIPEMDAFVVMILQTERFGTPIARALADFAALQRSKRTQAAEQAAAKTTVKISFPLILFIFPCIFIVLIGPALLTMLRSLGTLFHQ